MTTSTMIHISQKWTLNGKLRLVAAEEGEGEAAAGGDAGTTLPPSGPPHWSLVRFRNTSRARLSESRCRGKIRKDVESLDYVKN